MSRSDKVRSQGQNKERRGCLSAVAPEEVMYKTASTWRARHPARHPPGTSSSDDSTAAGAALRRRQSYGTRPGTWWLACRASGGA